MIVLLVVSIITAYEVLANRGLTKGVLNLSAFLSETRKNYIIFYLF